MTGPTVAVTETSTLRVPVSAQHSIRGARLAGRRDLAWLGPAVVSGMVLLMAVSLYRSGESAWALGLALAVAAAYALYFSYPWWGAWLLAARYRQLFSKDILVRLDATGLHAKQGASSWLRAWEDISDFVEDEEYIVMRQGRLPVAIIPKRAFAHSVDRDTFTTVLRLHLERARTPTPSDDIHER